MKVRIILFFLSLAISGTIIGCVQGSGGGNAVSVNELDGTNNSQDNQLSQSMKVSIDEATLEQVKDYVHECHGNKLCVQICHRPPGNPSNSKTMSLPLAATKAHLNHGGESHSEKDYLGPCHADDDSEDQSGDTDTNTDGDQTGGDTDGGVDSDTGSDTGVGAGDGSGSQEEVPLWCQPIHDLDSDCDGFDDSTGEALID